MVNEKNINGWAVMVPFDGDWMYVTEMAAAMDFSIPVVKTHPTKEEAEYSASLWGEHAKVVEYDKPSS